jgi:hypothetical protein
MLTIKIEEIEWLGCEWLVGFTEDHTSFLHLSEVDFVNAKKIGTFEQIDQITKEYYEHLNDTEESRKKLIERKQRRDNKYTRKSKKNWETKTGR